VDQIQIFVDEGQRVEFSIGDVRRAMSAAVNVAFITPVSESRHAL
jgi:hypothetical protein